MSNLMKRVGKPLSLGCIALLIALSLAACGDTASPTSLAGGTSPIATVAASGTTGTTAAPAPTVTPYPTVPQASGSIKLTFWHGLTGANGAIVQQVVNRFNSSQTKYYIDAVQNSNYDDTINKLNTSLAGGALPSIVQIYDIGTQRMIDTKKILPVQDFIEKEKLDLIKDLEPAVASYYTVGGKLYSMPFNSSAPVMYYDKKAFREAGLDPEKPPTTYDELIEVARKLVKKDASGKITRSAVDFSLYGWILEQQMAIQTTPYAEPNNGRDGRATKLAFNSEAGQNWLNFLKKLQDESLGRTVGRHSGTQASSTMTGNFAKGEAVMFFESIAVLRGLLNGVKTAGDKVEVGVAYLPKPTGAKGGVIIGGASLWITNQGTPEQQQGAWEFVKFTAQPDTQAFFASNTGYYPTRKSSYDLPEMKEALAKYPQFNVAINQLRGTEASKATAGAVFGTFAGTRTLVEGAMEQFLAGKAASAKAALDEAVNKANDNLTEYNSTIK